jgi:hypothetical protein
MHSMIFTMLDCNTMHENQQNKLQIWKSSWIFQNIMCSMIVSIIVFLCADELKKKISESYALFRSKVIEDLRSKDADWSELQQACR